MFAMTLWLGNTAYLYISVAFAQMLKAVSKYISYSYQPVHFATSGLSISQTAVARKLKHFNTYFILICSARSCFYSWRSSWTGSNEYQDAFDNVSDKFWSFSGFLWGNQH